MSHALVVKGKKTKNNLKQDPLQKAFHSLKNRIEILRRECEECARTLDRHLEFYETMIVPQNKQKALLLRQEIKLLYPYLKDKKQIKKEDRDLLKKAIARMFLTISHTEGPDMLLDEELSKIFKETLGFSFEVHRTAPFELFKRQMEKKFANLDLSNIKMEGSLEDAMDKVFDSMEEQGASLEQEDFAEEEVPRVKSKKEIREEQRALELEEFQKKEIGPLYKQLAKACHPDLETDPVRKLEKEALMKRITAAYDEKDLHALLALELEILLADDPEKKVFSEAQLKTYNRLLQMQIVELQGQLHRIPLEFKYMPLLNYTYYEWKRGDFVMGQIREELHYDIKTHKLLLERSEKDQALQLVREVIKSQRALELGEDDW